MNRPSAGVAPVCFFYCLIVVLLCQSIRPVQSIALSSICGHFGHLCFGGNWGKRELTTSSSAPAFIQSDSDTNDGRTAIFDENSMINFLVEQIRLSLLRKRLRQLVPVE